MTHAPEILLSHHLKTLKLPTFLREYEKVARQCASEGLDHVQFLTRLVELELIDRERRMIERRIKAAKFPATKSLDSFDFKAIPRLNKLQVLELARCEWIDRRENVIALGPSGTGKTHVALGLGLAACQKGMSVGFTTAAALVNELIEARDERRLLRVQKQMANVKLLGTVRNFVPWRIAYAIGKRSWNIMANWLFTVSGVQTPRDFSLTV
ncbi:ATP-binding protein [Cohaesibacter sp. CAU 1516]|uniref:ATP-binding protein n=1 Tax=Cohaesibacter sp. CAU 1516 TaxID=2576038 RepID=UPI001AEE5BB5|nr:ATP-binding protein [Cohaesibacter sp. CAU 1516]